MALYPFFINTANLTTVTITAATLDGADVLSTLASTGYYDYESMSGQSKGYTVEVGASNPTYPLVLTVTTGDGSGWVVSNTHYANVISSAVVPSGMSAGVTVSKNERYGMIVTVGGSGASLDAVSAFIPNSNGTFSYVVNANLGVTITAADPIDTVDGFGTPITLNTYQVMIRDWTVSGQNWTAPALFNTINNPGAPYKTYIDYEEAAISVFDAVQYANSGTGTVGYNSYIESGGGGGLPVANTPPTITAGTTLTSVEENSSVTAIVIVPAGTASDAELDPLTYEIMGGGGYVFVDSGTGEVTLSAMAPVGTYTFSIRANDGTDDSLWADYSIEVTAAPPNNAPVMGTSAQTINVVVGSTNMIVANNPATDADSDTLTYIIGGADAANFVLDTDGSVTLAPAVPVGTYTFTLKANDGTVDSNTATFTVIVGNAPPPVTVLPRTGGTSSGKYGRAGTGVLNMINTPTKQFGRDIKNLPGNGAPLPLVVTSATLLGYNFNDRTHITGMSVSIISTPAVSPVTLVQGGGTLNLRKGDTEVRPSIRRDDGTPEVLNDFTITIPIGSIARVRWLEIIE